MESPTESSETSQDGGVMLPPSPVSREHLQKRIDSLTQQNRLFSFPIIIITITNINIFYSVLKVELDTYKLRVKVLQEENRALRQASVIIVSVCSLV